MKTIPNYHPPSDYRRPTKTQEKVYVPVNDYPEINFSMLTNPLTLFQALWLSNTAVYLLRTPMRLVAACLPTNHDTPSFILLRCND
jgi:hypothetical protein